ncbi:MAG: sugar transferase [Actinobacteria bacterium]|nr:sugar transferase [Actinomycetota bacterium]
MANSSPQAAGSPAPVRPPALRVARLAPEPDDYEMPRTVYVRLVKPCIDRLFGAVLALVLAPLTAIVAVAVRCSVGPGVIFKQRRVGLGGQPFDVYKFRTMGHDRRRRQRPIADDRRRVHKSDEDPRHTVVGRFLRKWSLDELPQLWNVLRGEMSLIGPRPELVQVVERYEPWQHRRHAVKPGLTGLWQISRRGDGMMYLHTDLDLEYVDSVGLRADLGILLRTIPAMLSRRGD